ncbi:hypothetical protein D7W82_20220 [Corallococcus sp. CA049B]|nr:hypothetical protein D7W82_20220 [Corallococcus sp. CA049B]
MWIEMSSDFFGCFLVLLHHTAQAREQPAPGLAPGQRLMLLWLELLTEHGLQFLAQGLPHVGRSLLHCLDCLELLEAPAQRECIGHPLCRVLMRLHECTSDSGCGSKRLAPVFNDCPPGWRLWFSS